jgi:hypothetical protein
MRREQRAGERKEWKYDSDSTYGGKKAYIRLRGTIIVEKEGWPPPPEKEKEKTMDRLDKRISLLPFFLLFPLRLHLDVLS